MEATGAEKLITALGFPPEVGHLYERLLPLAGRPFDDVVAGLGLTCAEFEVVAADLIEAQIVEPSHEAVQVLIPALALSRLIETAAERARRAHEQLLSISRVVPHIAARSAVLTEAPLGESGQPIDGEVYRGRYLPETLSTLVRRTTGDLAWLRPDQWTFPWESDMNQLVAAAVASGRRARAIYPVRALAEVPAVLQARADVGEEIRVLPVIPTRLLVIGSTHAVLPEPLGEITTPRMIVRQRGLVEALALLFEELWEQASPVAEYERGAKGEEVRRQLLRQLASGAQDEQIARRLGMSLRTVRRRVAEVMAELGADSRFQAGVEAARRGWL
ncbi:helix-turn-helix transcriptional regulator [Nocardioides sp. BP30]|uniref:helix-turn-helix transcriptional regulator n=1 Tax=Nocardioides sp. BP30 TaxID=3036374 RepID=UPI00246831D9|nr:helix-turn-helix transcriptional regulator [Nocardioides sp. BP30]WGL52257.1 helix-turn-helix transcriptional regulator [Nocardioides sp. BP30]